MKLLKMYLLHKPTPTVSILFFKTAQLLLNSLRSLKDQLQPRKTFYYFITSVLGSTSGVIPENKLYKLKTCRLHFTNTPSILCIDQKHAVDTAHRLYGPPECSISLFLLLLGQVTVTFILFISKRPDIDYFTRKNDKWQQRMTRSAGSIREMIVLLVVC